MVKVRKRLGNEAAERWGTGGQSGRIDKAGLEVVKDTAFYTCITVPT